MEPLNQGQDPMALNPPQRKLLIIGTIAILTIAILSRAIILKDTELPHKEHPLMKVVVEELSAVKAHREVTFTGKTEPARRVAISPQTSGLITKLGAERGDFVQQGDLLIKIDMQDREQKLAQALALLKQREIEYDAALDLRKKNLTAESQLASAFTALESAKAQRDAIALDIEHTYIRAPFTGFLEERSVEIGHNLIANSFFTENGIASVIETNPLVISGSISEQSIGFVKKGMKAFATLAINKEVKGFVRYVSPRSNDDSRTFKIEILIANPEHKIPAGITAQVQIPGEEIWTHPISPDLLTLDDNGVFGIKTVNDKNQVIFHPATWAKASQDKIWLEGLPQKIKLITIGQGFVQAGEIVEPILQPSSEIKATSP